ncbi:MAG: dephospho-CoA kinase [Paludibacteraceae bacterium]|nr:dephospho-CoA kinase [Paludibacteraceae bacterium]MBQ9705115.1 dephospho-CoA kinase [Paludibacteraceae bacterium]
MLFGLTGGIGSGKSLIAQGLRNLGCAVYDTDSEARRIMQTNPCVRSQVELLFGSDIYCGDRLDRPAVAQLVFHDASLRERLNGIVHPAVAFDVEQWAKEQQGLCFVESAILFESGMERLCRAVVCITAPDELCIRRTMQRDGASREAVEARMLSQMSEAGRIARSQFVVCNDGSRAVDALCLDILHFCQACKP